jgi:hypothetical protein
MGIRVFALSFVAVAAVTRVAAAQPSDAVPQREPRGAGWYGLQTLAIDGAGIGVGLAALAIASPLSVTPAHVPTAGGYIATGVYAVGSVGAPAVHWAHHRVGVGFADMGMRVTVPPVTGLLGMLTYCGARNFHGDCAQNGMVGGVLAGEVFVASIDALLLARDEPEDASPPAARAWYGWQTMLAEVPGLGLGAYFAVQASSSSRANDKNAPNSLEAAGIGWWVGSVVVPPWVHVAHGRILVGLADAGARLLVPTLTTVVGILGYCSTTGGIRDCVADGALGGLGVGVAGMALFDALVLAREPAGDAGSRPPAPTGWAPTLQPARGGAVIGVGGMF